MKKLVLSLATILVIMLTSCSSDSSAVMSIEDTPETVDNTKVFMFKDVATHEKVSGAYAVKIKTANGIKYCALLGVGNEAFSPLDENSDLPKPNFETYATSIPMYNGIDIVWVVISGYDVFLTENHRNKYYGDVLLGTRILHYTELEK